MEAIRTYTNPADAQRDKETLAAAGLAAYVNGSKANGYSLLVAGGLVERAKALLK